ncbi:hypothetical protein TNCV_734501 [Trichonephila clavipes]|nr:hypothetical protein TNCV_734501 [Trichonephila clavipes]
MFGSLSTKNSLPPPIPFWLTYTGHRNGGRNARCDPILGCPQGGFVSCNCLSQSIPDMFYTKGGSSSFAAQIVRVQYFVRGGFVGHRSRASSKHLSSHLPVDGVRFFGVKKGLRCSCKMHVGGVGFNKDADHSRCSEK